MNTQRFQLTLSGRKPDKDPMQIARWMFRDLRGCDVASAVECPAGLRIVLKVPSEPELMEPKHIEAFVGILTERSGYRILGVQALFNGNLARTVESILK